MKARLPFFLAALAAASAVSATAGVRADRLEGRERAVYRWHGPAPPGFANNGFTQRVGPGGPAAEITIESDFTPLRSRTPWPVPAGRYPAVLAAARLAGSPGDRIATGSQTLYEAAWKILAEVKKKLRYDAATGGDSETARAAGRGDCVAFADLALRWLAQAGIAARPVTGVYLPRARAKLELKGGALHRFIEILFPDRGWVFTDPNFTFGAVTAEYIYLGPAGADYAAYEGVSLERVRLESRIRVEPRGGERYYARANIRDGLLPGDRSPAARPVAAPGETLSRMRP